MRGGRFRKAAHPRLQVHRRGAPARRPEAGQETLDDRFASLAEYLRAGNLYECAWPPFRLGHFKGMDDEAAALALAAWARRNHIHVMFAVQCVREDDVLFVLMRDKRQ